MEGYMTTTEAAEKWKICIRQVQNLCRNNRIEGVQRVGTNYLIPVKASKPMHISIIETDEK